MTHRPDFEPNGSIWVDWVSGLRASETAVLSAALADIKMLRDVQRRHRSLLLALLLLIGVQLPLTFARVMGFGL